ncbi:MAG TPA: glycosyltransferase, partial [Acidimicrobiales bacterium]|nr:glycosyltransferase [Acidimicrobiales bacterium]
MPVDGTKIQALLQLAAVGTAGLAVDERDHAHGTPPAGPPHLPRTLCIGMATYDDFDGVYFSVQALRLYHPEVMDRVSILVLDNDPTGRAAWPLKELADRVEELRYVPCGEVRGTAVRDLLFRYATADWVLVMDCHVLLEPGALTALLRYIDEHPDSDDLVQGPIEWDELGGLVATHFEPE